MTPPQFPYLPPGAAGTPLHPGNVRKPHSSLDIVATAVMSALMMLAALGSVLYSLLFAMVTDSCRERCDDATLVMARLVTWGGIGIAVLGAVAGIMIASRRRRQTWIWPTLALGIIVAALMTGVYLADSMIRHG